MYIKGVRYTDIHLSDMQWGQRCVVYQYTSIWEVLERYRDVWYEGRVYMYCVSMYIKAAKYTFFVTSLVKALLLKMKKSEEQSDKLLLYFTVFCTKQINDDLFSWSPILKQIILLNICNICSDECAFWCRISRSYDHRQPSFARKPRVEKMEIDFQRKCSTPWLYCTVFTLMQNNMIFAAELETQICCKTGRRNKKTIPHSLPRSSRCFLSSDVKSVLLTRKKYKIFSGFRRHHTFQVQIQETSYILGYNRVSSS